MKIYCFRQFLLEAIFCLYIQSTAAQSPFKFGAGGAIITNASEDPGFYTFLAPSFYFSYSFIKSPKFGVDSFLAFRSKEDEEEQAKRDGFAIAFPLTLEYRLSKLGFYAGVGPSYVDQTLTYNILLEDGMLAESMAILLVE